jgi:hypothetical protein
VVHCDARAARAHAGASSEAIPVALSTCEKAPTWRAFLEVQEEVAELVRSSSDLDLTRLRFRNPLLAGLPLFNLATGFLVIVAHERRHLEQARAVRANAGFPP